MDECGPHRLFTEDESQCGFVRQGGGSVVTKSGLVAIPLDWNIRAQDAQAAFHFTGRLDDHAIFSHFMATSSWKALLNGQGKTKPDRQANALEWIDLLSGTRDKNGESFLPLRAHFFHQTISGLWACSDEQCSERSGFLADSDWHFGQIYTDPRKHCDCGSPAYELVTCTSCGAVHLLCSQLRKLGNSGYYPNQLWHDWQDLDTRTHVIKQVLQSIELQAAVSVFGSVSEIKHGRPLRFKLSSNRIVEVRFDQGMEHWRVPQSTNFQLKRFDFNLSSQDQAAKLNMMNNIVEGQLADTQVFLSVRENVA